MNVWCTFSTIFKQRRVLQIAGLLTLCVAFITMLFFSSISNAAPGVNQTISFQGRLLTPQGQPVPEGYYNIQFKIYQGGTGTVAGNPSGTHVWTETYINDGGNNAVHVKNGYFSVDLGSKNAFANQVDWNDDTLWLSMNIAGSSTVCTTFGTAPCLADGEMLPMKRLTSTPYALNAGKVGGKSADELIHNGTSQQTGNFNISGTGIANILQGSTGVISPYLDRADAGALTIGTTNATSILIGGSGNQTINIGTGGGEKIVNVGSISAGSGVGIQGGSLGVGINTSGGFGLKNINSDLYAFSMSGSGDLNFRLGATNNLEIMNESDETLLTINNDGTLIAENDISSNGNIIINSADKSKIAGLTWAGGNNTAYVASTGNTVALQGSGVDLLTAKNTAGKATIGIGNAASNGYALDVTGEINASAAYKINGTDVLGSNSLAFSGASGSGLTSNNGDGLRLYSNDGIKIGDTTASSTPTLLTLDKGTGTPSVTGDAVLGSMYYDTTLGKVQCYEADGWGSCSSSPDNFVTLSPEYTNAVMNGSGIGEMTSDICSDALNLNDGSSAQPTICGTNETYNFYNWTTEETSAQTKDIYVTYQLPSNFTGFVDGSTSLVGRTDNAAANVSYRVYKNTASGLVACGSAVAVSTGAQTTWQKVTATGSADPTNCGFSANDSLVIKISMTSEYTTQATNAYVSTLSFAFSND